MFEILLPTESEMPIYRQIYRQIRELIVSGRLPDGTKLPSVRALQVQLNISKTPIETAYQMLTAEGYVVSKPRSGLFAATHGIRDAERAEAAAPSRNAACSEQPTPAARPAFVADFDPTALDSDLFPWRTWMKTMKEAMEMRAGDIGKYGHPQGEFELRLALADYLRHSRGVNASPERIAVGVGMAYSIGVLTKLLPGPRRVAIEEPGYNLVRDRFELNGYEIVPIPVGERGLSIDALERISARAVYVTPSHQFPTGVVMPYPERQRLLEWAVLNDAYIIEDDYDGEFRYHGKPIPSLQSLDAHGRVVYIGTFSKALTPALRMNYMVLPPDLLTRLSDLPQEIVYAPSRVEQWAMRSFIEQGHWYRHIRKARNAYRRKHRRIIDLIRAELGDRVEITGQDAGLHIRLTVKTGRSTEELIRLAAAAGVKVYDFRKMWLAPPTVPPDDPQCFLGFAGIEGVDMDIGIRALRRAWFRD
ncbi:PLP-dependent aminotransferase family protein [Paenibacillus antri]|uniref:PLP-dependent aminotransferase family protein n=1 Tax=Paenibacillus antri TaxID=2582848 RepID=A0A5R9GE07_9BACL|nr:PLP-dependent aminotransferase family protein [Paenibacillus antri]TLS52340.1 PLP-dependent aminotransferase family protein [Paenibacillus antri]